MLTLIKAYRFEWLVFYAAISHLTSIRRSFLMGKHEIISMFGATTLGALWQPIALGVNIFGIGVIFGNLFNLPVERYVPFLCIGMILWNALVSVLGDCTDSLNGTSNTRYDELIIYPIRICAKHALLSTLNFSIYIIVAIIFGKSITFAQLLFFLLGTTCFFWILTALGIIFSIVGAVFKDFSNILRNFLSLMFFITPVMWEPGGMEHRWIFIINPIYHLIEMIRAPLISWETYDPLILLVSGMVTIFLLISSLFVWAGWGWLVPYKQ